MVVPLAVMAVGANAATPAVSDRSGTGVPAASRGAVPTPVSRPADPVVVLPAVARQASPVRRQTAREGRSDLVVIPPAALAAYQRAAVVMDTAQPSCHLPWTLLAAVGQVESDHGRSAAGSPILGPRLDGTHGTRAVPDTDGGVLDGDARWDRAVGPMQFLPSTWRLVRVDANGDGRRDPQDLDDAALGAAVYLCGSGQDLATADGRHAAVATYNHSAPYVEAVLGLDSSYASQDAVSVDPLLLDAAVVVTPVVDVVVHHHHHPPSSPHEGVGVAAPVLGAALPGPRPDVSDFPHPPVPEVPDDVTVTEEDPGDTPDPPTEDTVAPDQPDGVETPAPGPLPVPCVVDDVAVTICEAPTPPPGPVG